jgi:hypothetical protein
MERDETRPRFVMCVRNDGYAASLEPRKIYQAVPDESASARKFVRVIDESGEDYLYPEDFFVPIELPQEAQEAFARAS